MTDHPIPDDLLDWLNAYEWDDQQPNVAHKDHVYDAWCAICRGDLPRILTALAEWADGCLIDPATWTRWDREEVGSGWYRNRLTGELSPWGDDEPCPPENRVYTLTPRGDQ